MSLTRLAVGSLGGAAVLGGLSAATAAATGATGAAILSSAGYAGYIVSEAAQMGAIGGLIPGASLGFIGGALASCGLFSINTGNEKKNDWCSIGIAHVGGAVLNGLIGYGVMNANGTTVMELAKTAAAFAVGGSVLMMPSAAITICITLPLVAVAYVLAEKAQEVSLSYERIRV